MMDDSNQTDKQTEKEDEDRVCCTKICNPNTAIHRYIILFFICLCGVGDYFCLDMPASLESNILHDLHLTEKEYMGFYSWVYWPSAVTSLLSGFLIDRILGVRLGIGIFSWLVSVGQVIHQTEPSRVHVLGGTSSFTYLSWLLCCCCVPIFITTFPLNLSRMYPWLRYGVPSPVLVTGLFATGAFINKYWVMCVGRILFALAGTPFALSTQKLTAKWFQGRELNAAFGLRVSVARVGSVVNMNVMQPIYTWFSKYFQGYQCLGMAIYVGVAICVISFLAGLVLCYLDKRADTKLQTVSDEKESRMRLSDIKEFALTFWLISLITTIYYLALFPFIGLGPVFFEMKYEKDRQIAGNINSLPYMVSLSMPIFGLMIDKTGRNLIWLFVGVIMSLGAHALFTFTFVDPYVPVIILGVGYTIVTAVVWPLVAYVVKEKHLGTAYGILNAMISVGQAGISTLTGYLADSRGYLILQVFFMACVSGSLILCVWLYLSDSLRGGILMASGRERSKQNQKEITVENPKEDRSDDSLISESQR